MGFSGGINCNQYLHYDEGATVGDFVRTTNHVQGSIPLSPTSHQQEGSRQTHATFRFKVFFRFGLQGLGLKVWESGSTIFITPVRAIRMCA